jgi:glutaredoxin-like YruB-family protein
MKVKIYSTPSCSHCQHAKEFFKENNVEFEDVNVQENQEAAKEMIEKSGQQGVPVIVIDDKWDEAIVGFNEGKLKEKLKL